MYDLAAQTFTLGEKSGRFALRDGLLVLTPPDGKREDAYIRASAQKAPVIVGSMTKIVEGRQGPKMGQGSPPRFTSRPLIQPFGYKSSSLSNSLHIAVLTIPDGLPDLVDHIGHLRARADAPIAAMNDHLTWLGRIFEASSVPLRQELFKRGRARMLRKRHCFNRQSSPEKRRSPQRADDNEAPRRDKNSRPVLTVCNACNVCMSLPHISPQ